MTLPSYQCTLRDDRTSHCVAQSCNLAHDTINRLASRPLFSFLSASSSASMATAIPLEKLILSVLSSVSPGLSVQELRAVPSSRLQLLYNVKLSEGPSLLLTLPPPAVIRLLRSERSSIGTEASVLKWLSSLSNHNSTNPNSRAKTPPKNRAQFNTSRNEITNSQRIANPLSGFLPILVRHESMGDGVAVEYNLSYPTRGSTISSLPYPLTQRERREVDFQTGQLIRYISSQISPTRRFGIASDVLSVPTSTPQECRVEGSLHASRGASCWSVAFHSLLESILRDGEDLSIMIGYGAIRRHFDHFKHLLDAVTKPRLVVMDAGEEANLLVFRSSEPRKKTNSSSRRINEKWAGSQVAPEASNRINTNHSSGTNYERYQDETDSEHQDNYTRITDDQTTEQIEVTGLRQWTNCLFGDPLIGSVFSKHPAEDFWNGFDRPISEEEDAKSLSTSIVEDEPNAHIRLLLYECYHAVVAVVQEFYRPQSDSNKRELAARKQLGSILARLDELNGVGLPRRRRPSGEESPAKRPKSGDEDDGD